jgi:uncharacterized protein
MIDEIKQLLLVQEIDKDIILIQETLQNYPKTWDKVKEKLTEARAAHERASAAEEKFQKESKRLEQKLRLSTEDLKRAQVQQNSVKTGKEYEAATKQLDFVKRQIEDLQKRAESMLERREDILKAARDSAKVLEETETLYKSEKKRIREQFNVRKEELAALEVRRETEISKVDAKTRKVYERISTRHPGNVVVPVVNEKTAGEERGTNGCAGCYFEVLPEVLVRIRREDEIIPCTNCGRVLYEQDTILQERIG